VNDKATKIYIKTSDENHETIFSGIKFNDFIECTPTPVKNILLLKSGYFGEKRKYNFELLEGQGDVKKLMSENIYHYGDFCFVDYSNPDSVREQTREQIAELLYLAHMNEPLKSPFWETLQNNFAYLSHDDGWYCKLYCRNQQDSASILINKLQNVIQKALCENTFFLPNDLIEKTKEVSKRGLLVKLDTSVQREKAAVVKLYEVGEYHNIDDLFNSIEQEKPPVFFEIKFSNN